jgi:N-acetylglutamate synthase-like GNAT family acetyltransferase
MSLIRRWILRERLDVSSLKWQNFLVADHQDEIVGIGQVKQHPGTARELASLVTHPAYRGQRIAPRIIQALEARHGLPMYLMCNAPLEPFYRANGYEVVGWRELPVFIRLRYTAAFVLRLVGIRVLAMRKTKGSS